MFAFFKNIKRFFGGGKEWIILLLSLLLAFFMWSIQRLSLDYSAYIKFRVNIVADLNERTNSSISKEPLIINAKVSGFDIIRNNYYWDKSILTIKVDAKSLYKTLGEEDDFYLLTNDIKQNIQESLGSDIIMNAISTDTLFLHYPKQTNKKVKVVAKSQISYKSQYMPLGNIILKPDSVYIYGESAIINAIDSIYTKVIFGDNIDSKCTGVIDLSYNKNIRVSNDKLFYSLDVVRFVENEKKIRVKVENLPLGSNFAIIPAEVLIKYREPLEGVVEHGVNDFELTIDYKSIGNDRVVKPNITKMPSSVIWYSIYPHFIECVY